MNRQLKVFTGNANRALADAICRYLEVPLGEAVVGKFSDGETSVEIGENVRDANCFVVQPTCAPVNQHVMELLIMIDALKRASTGCIVAVVPYFGYSRQDRKSKPRTPISAKLVADILTRAGADRVLAVDLHAGQLQGFFDIPVDNLYGMPKMTEVLRGTYQAVGVSLEQVVVVSPDAGGVQRAREYAKRLGTAMAIIDKRRAAANVSEVMNIIGDVKGKHCVLVDDIIDTAGTICNAALALKNQGADSVTACATHGVLSGPAFKRLQESVLQDVLVSDTIPVPEEFLAHRDYKIRVVSLAPLLGEAIRRIHHGDSVSSLFR